MRVTELKALMRECELRGYSWLRKAELIAFLQNNLLHARPPRPNRSPQPARPNRPPPPPPPQVIAVQAQLVRFRPDRPRQPELMRRLATPQSEFKPYRLKPKRREESFLEPLAPVEPPAQNPPNPKKLKKMKKKLDELNRKIRHSRKKNNGLIHKRNSLRKVIEEMQRGNEKPIIERPFIFIGCELAYGRAYRSYRVERRPKMDLKSFFKEIRRGLMEKIKQELVNRRSARIQTNVWIRFVKDEDRINLVFNSRMMDLH